MDDSCESSPLLYGCLHGGLFPFVRHAEQGRGPGKYPKDPEAGEGRMNQ